VLLQLSGNLVNFGNGGAHSTIGDDQHDYFRNTNDRDVRIDISLPARGPTSLTRVAIRAARKSPVSWSGELFVGPEQMPVVAAGNAGFKLASGNVVALDTNALNEFLSMTREMLYIGPFRNAITEGSGEYYDLSIGTSFISLWDSWKNGPHKWQSSVAQLVSQQLERIFGYERLEINRSADGNSVRAVLNGNTYDLREIGAGLAQFLVVLGNVAIRRPSFVLIDEPELHLHPALQARFLTELALHARDGVMFATHSIGLARRTADYLYSFQSSTEGSLVHPFVDSPALVEFLGEMSFSLHKEIGFDKLLLVEGGNEFKATQELLRKLGKDHSVLPYPLGGTQLIRGGVEHELAELKRICDHIAVLIDSERLSADAPLSAEREEFVRICRALGFSVHVTKRRAFENYFPDRAIQAVKGAKYRALGPFEALSDCQPAWAKHENWRICMEMTRDELLASDVGEFLRDV